MGIVNDVFNKVSVLALEDWGLALVESIDVAPDIFPEDQIIYCGTTQFKGVMTGNLTVLCCRPFLENICRNLLGLPFDEDVSKENCEDTLTELVNVFCGNFLTEAYGDDVVFELVFPSVEIATPERLKQFFSSRLVHCFLADDEPVALALGSVQDSSAK